MDFGLSSLDYDDLMRAGPSDTDVAEEALRGIYAGAGLDTPEFVWVSSPRDGFARIAGLFEERGPEMRRRAIRRILDPGKSVCVCRWCRGVAVNPFLVPKQETYVRPDPNVERRQRGAAQAWRTVLRGLWRDAKVDSDFSSHLRKFAELVGGSLPFGNPWTVVEGLSQMMRRGDGPLDKGFDPRWVALAASAGWWWLYEGLAVVSLRPIFVAYDSEWRLHCDSGPALRYVDGWGMNVVEGTLVWARFFEPDAITLEVIRSEENLEVRRLMIDRYGPERYVADCGATLVDSDEYGELWWIGSVPGRRRLPEMAMVKVVDATPGPDGRRRVYWLHVPPTVQTAREAVAWTFGLPADSYRPEVET